MRTARSARPSATGRLGLALATVMVAACTGSAGPSPSIPPSPASGSAARISATPVANPSAATAPVAWRRVADIPTPRSEIAVAVWHQSLVFAIGGQGGPQRVERYDAAADKWDRGPDLPIGVDHTMAAVAESLQSNAPHGTRLPLR